MSEMSSQAQSPTVSKSLANWSRTGCITCKRRRKRCDRTQPSCTNCKKRGLRCEGYQQLFVHHPIGTHSKKKNRPTRPLGPRSPSSTNAVSCNPAILPELTWIPFVPESTSSESDVSLPGLPEDMIGQSLTAIDETVSGPADAVMDMSYAEIATPNFTSSLDHALLHELLELSSEDPFPCFDGQDLDILQEVSVDLDAGLSSKQGLEASANTLSSPRPLSIFPNFTNRDFYYLQYLDEQAANQLLNLDPGEFNPLRRFLLPRAMDCAGVLNGLCAVAARHQAQRSDPDSRIDLSVVATSFYVKTINWLRSSFSQKTSSESPMFMAADEGSVITVLLLCKYEIISGSATQWRDHLKGLERLIQLRGGIASLEIECGQYVASFLRYHRIVADICHPDNSLPNHDENELDAVASTAFPMDVYSGCAHYLLKACQDIARLAGRIESQAITNHADLQEQTTGIVAALGTPVIEPNIPTSPGSITLPQISRLIYVAQRTRYAAYVFLHSVIERAIDSGRFGKAECDTLQRQIPYTKTRALEGCLDMLRETPIGKNCEFAGIALALFLAGCEVEEESLRYLILEKLFAIERNFGLGHIARAKDALMIIWERDEGGGRKFWWNVIRDVGWRLILC